MNIIQYSTRYVRALSPRRKILVIDESEDGKAGYKYTSYNNGVMNCGVQFEVDL